ncbi:PepSY domain-containing protein [Pseudomonas sp. Irchel 3E20]|uniref:PepSY domain-containing protein n=1 Tax=Pseudomonas sp. Irchel 3E20 TaxID=2008983 RepID=UPI000BA2D152|nr:PepSY domain-containing protein [Pseudomonas sp. Irchel 3E20]
MKMLTALFAATALTLTAGLAQADVRPDQIPGLLKNNTIQDMEQLNQKALAKQAGQIVDTELDQRKDGTYVYEVEVLAADGKKWDVELNAKTGEVIRHQQDH